MNTDCLGEKCDEWFNKSCIGLLEALNGRLIGSKAWNRDVGFLKPMWIVSDCPRADVGS